MNSFLEEDLNIASVDFALFVKENFGVSEHKNRPQHGLAFNVGQEKSYIFDERKRLTVGQNDIIFLPAKSNYRVECAISGNCYAVNFKISGKEIKEPFIFKPKNVAFVLKKFKALEMTWLKKGKTYLMDCKAILYEIISYMQNEYELEYMPKSTKRLILPAVDYMHRNYTSSEIKIPELAKICGISEDYLRKLFSKVYNTSPLKYANNLKLAHSEELIMSGMYTVSEAAQLSGYSDMSYFSREFKKHFGMPPAEYKKSLS